MQNKYILLIDKVQKFKESCWGTFAIPFVMPLVSENGISGDMFNPTEATLED